MQHMGTYLCWDVDIDILNTMSQNDYVVTEIFLVITCLFVCLFALLKNYTLDRGKVGIYL